MVFEALELVAVDFFGREAIRYLMVAAEEVYSYQL